MNPAVRKEPKGTVLIIAPFNYPVLLLLGPMASAIAAGCAVVVKPSELTPASSALMAELISTHLDQDLFRLVNGAIPETTRVRNHALRLTLTDATSSSAVGAPMGS